MLLTKNYHNFSISRGHGKGNDRPLKTHNSRSEEEVHEFSVYILKYSSHEVSTRTSQDSRRYNVFFYQKLS